MINYKHLHYFWAVAQEGSIARASKRLHLTPQTISGQVTLLEESLGIALFLRVGRHLELTESGRLILSYADEIFSLGDELEAMVHKQRGGDRPPMFTVGVTDAVPKSIAYRLLCPVLRLPEPMCFICREGALDTLLGELTGHRIDLVIAEGSMPPNSTVRGLSHLLRRCGVTFFAAPALVEKIETDFPICLNGMPLLLPGQATAMRTSLLRWVKKQRVHPQVIGEFDDSAMMNTFGQQGAGIFVAPSLMEMELEKQYGVYAIGRTEAIIQEFYAISMERRISHPAVAAIIHTARERFSTDPE